jgi:serine/threonine protein kinase
MSDMGVVDHRELLRRLQTTVESTHSSSKNKDLDKELGIAAYLFERYANQGNYVNGRQHVEVDARLGWGGSISLGKGASGNVDKTTWFGFPCAKKVQVLGAMEDGAKFFKKEVAILASVNHPNVVKFICCGRKPKKLTCFIAMELLDTNLEELIKEVSNGGTRTSFPIQVAMDIILQIAKGMSYLHEKKIAHRDLKPANVLVHKIMVDELHKDNYVNVKLADFGLSQTEAYSNISEELSRGIGTRLYKAPELFQNKKRKRDNMMYTTVEKVNAHEADVYSFGVMCATILSGRQPFEGNDHDLPTRLRSGERPWVPDDCPEAMISLINECWSLDRTKRPKFKEICTTLEELRSSILRGNVALTKQEVENKTTLSQRISNLPRDVVYMFKRFWMKPNLEGREANEAQHTSQIHPKVLILTIY